MSFRRYYIWRAEDEVRINSLLAPLSALDHPQRQPCLLTHPCSLRCQCRCRCTAVINATTLAAGRPSAACATFATSDATTLAALAASHLHPHVYVVAINGPAQLMSASGAGRPSASRHLRPQVLGKYETPAQHASAHHDAPLPRSIRPLKEFLLQQRSDATPFSKESELIAEVRRLKRVLTLCHLSNRPRLRPHPRPRAAPCAGGGGKRGNVGGSERQKAHNKHRHC